VSEYFMLMTLAIARLQSELYNVREERDMKRISKVDISEDILRDARTRLDALQTAISQTSRTEDAEFSKILEGLVSENEALKHDNAELQNLLTDSREDIRSLREEIEEYKAGVHTPAPQDERSFVPFRSDGYARKHKVKESWASSASAPAPLSPPRSDGFLSPRLSVSRARTSSHSIVQTVRKPIVRSLKSPSEQGDDKFIVSYLS
jgi:hypothetical protein